MNYLLLLWLGCLPPLAYKNYAGSNFETTRIPCVDALYVNLDLQEVRNPPRCYNGYCY